MQNVGEYEATETLRNGRRATIRALRPDDKVGLLAALGRSSARSIYRRFFGPKRGFTEAEIEFFLNIDFVNHVALVAVVTEDAGQLIVGGCRYIVGRRPGQAEVAFTVMDQYQGQGVGAALLRHIAAIAREAGLKVLTADVLADNIPMLKVFEKSGLRLHITRESGVVHVVLDTP